MPQFNSGSVHTARMPMNNPTTKAFDYSATLFMGIDQAAMAEASFHLNAGESKEVSFSVAMPSTTGEYPVYIGVFSEGVNVGLFQATENVIIVAPTVPPFNISGSGVGQVCPLMTSWWYPDLTFIITNPNSVQVTHTLQLWKRSFSLGTGEVETPNAVTLGGNLIPPGQGSPVSITLQPGGSYTYRITGWVVHPQIPGMVSYQLTMARPRSYFYWLQDELGNMSPEVNIVRS